MHRVGFLLAAIVGVAGFGMASATPAWRIGVHGGASHPFGDMASGVANGFHVGLSVEESEDQRNGFVLQATDHRFGDETNGFGLGGSAVSFTQRADIVEVGLFVRASLLPRRDPFDPYLKAGACLERVHSDLTVVWGSGVARSSMEQSGPGLAGGVGFSTRLGNASRIGLEGLIHGIEIQSKPSTFATLAVVITSAAPR